MTKVTLLTHEEGGFRLAIEAGLQAHGCHVTTRQFAESWQLGQADYLLLYGPMFPIHRTIARLEQAPRVPPILFWFTEQLPHPRLPLVKALAMLRWRLGELGHRIGRLRAIGDILALQKRGWLQRIAVFSERHQATFAQLGCSVVRAPMGLHLTFGERLQLARDVDVLFLGTTRDRRRKRIIAQLTEQFAVSGINFVIKDGSQTHGHVFETERTELINRSKILLNVMRQPWDDLTFRALLAAGNGAMLLSEPVAELGWGDFRPNHHFIMGEIDQLATTAKRWLADDAARQAVAETSYQLVVTQMTIEQMTGRLLNGV